MFWFDLTWEMVRKLDKENVFVILPIGSCEQHSLHLPLGMDTYSAYLLSIDVAKAFEGKGLVLPPIWYGASEHHMDFDGTITLKHETLMILVYDIVASLKKHGFSKIVIINGHGGNTDPLKVAIRKIRDELGVSVLLINPWELIRDFIEEVLESKIWGHACEFETSIALRIIPEKVVRDKIVDPELNIKAHERIEKFIYPWHTKEITNTGSIGYPSKASYEKGERLYNEMLRKTIEHIKNFIGS